MTCHANVVWEDNSNKQSWGSYQGAMVETNNKEIMNFFALLRDTMHIWMQVGPNAIQVQSSS